MRKKFLMFLALELILTAFVILLFKTIPDKSTVGLIAGTLFISIGVYIVSVLIREKAAIKAFSFYGALVHLLVGTFPLFLVRILNWGVPHENLFILGLPAPTFHKVVEKIFVILILCTLVDYIKTFIPVREQN